MIRRRQRMLVIRRSQTVRAPGMFCFPGGEVEAGEGLQAALIREIDEELNLPVAPGRHIWTSVAPSGCQLNWVLATICDGHQPEPNVAEVESYTWLTLDQLAVMPNVLSSNLEFIEAFRAGLFSLD